MTEEPSGNYEAEESIPSYYERVRRVGRNLDADDPAVRLAAGRHLHRMDSNDRAYALHIAAYVALRADKYDIARVRYEEYVEICKQNDVPEGVVEGLSALVGLARKTADVERERSLYQELIPLAEATGDIEKLAQTYYYWSLAELDGDNPEKGLELMGKGLGLFREISDPLYVAYALRNLARALAMLGNADAAVQSAEESLAAFEEIGDTYQAARAHQVLARYHHDASRFEASAISNRSALLAYRALDHRDELREVACNLIATLKAKGDIPAALRLCGALKAELRRDPNWESGIAAGYVRKWMDWADRLTWRWRYHRQWWVGQSMTTDQAVDFAVQAAGR